jgi:hypothetical protein
MALKSISIPRNTRQVVGPADLGGAWDTPSSLKVSNKIVCF